MFILYETTCLVNGKKYIGVHQQETDDGYLGSGKHFLRAVRKYGKENFVRKTLETFQTRKDAYLREAELVDDNVVSSPEYYNMVPGGKGGNIWTNKEETCQKLKDNWTRTPERLERLRTMNKGRTISDKHKEALFQGRRDSAKVYEVTKDGDTRCLTIRDFCAIHGGNIQSARQMVWKHGKYKGYTFIPQKSF